ncbi:YjhX family toxin [Gymnodinialimonas sp.]
MPEAFSSDLKSRDKPLNISRHERRVLHVLAQGGAIHFERMTNGKMREVSCFTRDGHVLADCSLKPFDRLKKGRFIKSVNGRPYRASRLGIRSVNPQYDNR